MVSEIKTPCESLALAMCGSYHLITRSPIPYLKGGTVPCLSWGLFIRQDFVSPIMKADKPVIHPCRSRIKGCGIYLPVIDCPLISPLLNGGHFRIPLQQRIGA